ncbi:Nucleotidyltransferase [Myriangium duriaei CBS 260.36]|uniref:DNA polymerase n=1 Tax=Myriangium duriaei CBS 260.36 TaxID=1168546 RepID=A0A9P4J6S3_9PEZI|nr:Nucleotidyltransferase [Myriangium duriaei CBS 260.36]
MTSPASSQTLEGQPIIGHNLDLSLLPPIFVSLTHFAKDAADSFEDRLLAHGANVSYDLSEVKIVLTRADRKRRAQFDLRSQGISTEEVDHVVTGDTREPDDNAPFSNTEDILLRRLATPTVKVIKLAWMEECISQGHLIPIDNHILFEGRIIPAPTLETAETNKTPTKRKRESPETVNFHSPESILARARHDAERTSPRTNRDFGIRRFGDKHRSNFTAPYAAGASSQKPLHLLSETTSEHEGYGSDSDLPPIPDWVSHHQQYACQRVTLANGPNDAFLSELKEIRTARLLTGDEIGVRAYSTSIASIAAYPYALRSPKEILRLPGCDVKIANLFVEHANTGRVHAADAARRDPELKVLRLFYEIWGVGATTARDFYYSRGWRDLDDVVEFGWSTLSRVQQIGVKYYEDFQLPIPRAEVEDIARVIHRHAAKVRDSRVQSILVGGYRRGKTESGDVDVLISHPDTAATKNLVTDIVESLEDEGCITHTLLLALTSTHRDQQTLPFRAIKEKAGAGFDTLDKALVVWQDPHWPSEVADKAKDEGAKNPAPHRRVDIIVSPWRTVGCAVAGWTSGTTFQRDLRRYAKHVKGWKFDSSGVRERGGGSVVDVEGYYAQGGGDRRARTMEEAERRVFEAFGLEWREPWERCTG